MSLWLKLIIAGLSFTALLFHSGVFLKKIRKSMFVYFTNVTLAFCVLFFIAVAIRGYSQFLIWSGGYIVLCVFMTMAVYHFVLVPVRRKEESDSLFSFSDIVSHYVIPVLVIVDWVFFAEKGKFGQNYPFLWTVPSILYFFATVAYAKLATPKETGEKRYPYYFFDFDKLGFKKVSLNVMILLLIVVLLGSILLFLDFSLSGQELRNS